MKKKTLENDVLIFWKPIFAFKNPMAHSRQQQPAYIRRVGFGSHRLTSIPLSNTNQSNFYPVILPVLVKIRAPVISCYIKKYVRLIKHVFIFQNPGNAPHHRPNHSLLPGMFTYNTRYINLPTIDFQVTFLRFLGMNHLPQKTWPPDNTASKRRCKNSGDGEGEKVPGNLPSTKPGSLWRWRW